MARSINKLTAVTIANLNERGLYADGGGLWLQVSAWGTKAWIFRYQRNGKRHLKGLGPIHSVSLQEARTRARQERQLILDGRDPLQVKRDAVAAERLLEARRRTFEQCAEEYLRTMLEGLKNDKHRKQWRTTLEETFPILGALPVADIDTPAIVRVLTPIWERAPETGSRLRGRIEKVLGWATVRGYRDGDNPARWTNHLDQVFAKHKAKSHAALPYAEIPAFMAKLRKRDSVSARALEFLILTAADVNPVISAKWTEIDLKAKTWTSPAYNMKNDKDHVVPLSGRALAILKALPKVGDHIFINGGGKPLSNAAMPELLKGMIGNKATVKGFRSTFRDWAGDKTDHAHETIEFAMRHQVPNKAEAAYRRYRALDKRSALMSEWCGYCAG
jgi:integrase